MQVPKDLDQQVKAAEALVSALKAGGVESDPRRQEILKEEQEHLQSLRDQVKAAKPCYHVP